MELRSRTLRTLFVAAVAGLAVAGLPATATAAQPSPPQSGGGHGADFTGDGIPDILARAAGTGVLKVYPHSGTFDGTATYLAPVTIDTGWQDMRWIGAADYTGDGFADVVAIDNAGRMVIARHSGTFDGTNTLLPGLTPVGTGWDTNDLVAVAYDDGTLLARRIGTGKLYLYRSNGLQGTGTFDPPTEFDPRGTGEGQSDAVHIGMAALTRGGEGPVDFVYTNFAGELHAVDPYFHWDTVLGYGWQSVDSIVMTDLDQSYYPDIVARDRATGNLVGYLGTDTGITGPYVLGHGWQNNDIIT